ncbi:MAG: AAA family ATPase [Candidatus Gracilibacteria bacterium]
MKILSLNIRNYDVIREAKLENLSDLVVVAGPNGVGKTKIVEAIVNMFQTGTPPANCEVTLEATCAEEKMDWRSDSLTLPNTNFWNKFTKRSKKIHSKARLINIDATRQIENIQFQQYNLSQIGDPSSEEVDHTYSSRRIRDRFQDICNTLYREKAKLLTNLGREAYIQFDGSPSASEVKVNRPNDLTKKFEEIFEKMLYPKKMMPIEVNSSTIQFIDNDGATRSFDRLSSGEKEAIVLAFDIMLQDPSDSIILIDEPELHLHPELTFRLVKVLRSIGERNQIFLFTHSTDIIGNAFETGIHFIRPKSALTSGNQAIRVDLDNVTDLKVIPNLREAIGMISLGKKLLFVEGDATSIDRNVFATIAKSEKLDFAIVPSDSCHNINNLALISETLSRGLFGIDLFMVRDRDSLTETEIATFTTKSGNRLSFLPCYHIENVFLVPSAIYHIYQKLTPSPTKTLAAIEEKMIQLAREQINASTIQYVSSEVRFKVGNFDINTHAPSVTDDIETLVTTLTTAKNDRLSSTATQISDSYIEERTRYWKETLENSIASGWTEEARKFFYGKSILKNLQQWLFPTKDAPIIWEHMVNDEDPACRSATEPLRSILTNIR